MDAVAEPQLLLTWVLTVASLTMSSWAICALERPAGCQATYALSNGTVVAAGVARIGGSAPVTVAVTGGTGAYAGARGTLTSSNGRDTLTLQ